MVVPSWVPCFYWSAQKISGYVSFELLGVVMKFLVSSQPDKTNRFLEVSNRFSAVLSFFKIHIKLCPFLF